MSTENEDIRQKITRFVANNELLERLNARIHRFNPLSVLKVNHFEIRHSNMLAWLLDPSENHGMSDTVLKKVISETLCGDVVKKNHTLEITDVLLGSYHDAEVFREWRNIDILVVSKKNNFVLLIENKVHAGLASHQLDKYISIVRQSYPGITNIIPVFLTLSGDDSPHPEYYNFDHGSIYEILRSVLTLQRDKMNPQVHDFIHYYTLTLEELTMQDEQLIQLCRDIYKHHKNAIDAIVEYGMPSSSELSRLVETLRTQMKFVDYTTNPQMYASNKEHWFLPEALSNQIPKLLRKWKSPYPISYFFAAEENSLRMILEVGPMTDGQSRLDFLNRIASHDTEQLFTFRGNTLSNVNASYTRIRTKSIKIDDWDDVDFVVERAMYLVDKELRYDNVNKALNEVLQTYTLGNPSDSI